MIISASGIILSEFFRKTSRTILFILFLLTAFPSLRVAIIPNRGILLEGLRWACAKNASVL